MPRRRRIQFEGGYYHVFNRGVEKRPIVLDDRDRKTFLQLLGETVREYRLRLFAFCLMSNHYHLFLQTPIANLDCAMQSCQSQYAHYLNLRYERVGPLFQGRYQNPIVDADRYALALTRYIHYNPIEAGICQRLEDYPWSSYPCYVGTLPTWPWLSTELVLGLLHAERAKALERFVTFHQTSPPKSDRELFERTPRGRPRIRSKKGV